VADVTTPIVALDVPSLAAARAIVDRLGAPCDFYKVGLQLFVAEGPSAVGWLRDQGKRVFLDLKLHDIPNTVRAAARSAVAHGASLLTVHASGSAAMLAAAVDGAGAQDGTGCGVLAVTVLTSLAAADVELAWGRPVASVQEEVLRLAGIARAAGTFGVVCAGTEAAGVVAAHGPALRVLVPGVRGPGDASHDQARVVTPAAAAAAGAAYVVLGRMVTAAADPVAAFAAAAAQLGSVPPR
jgi:orotidine-5'-phosphate decarboxylase